MMNHTHYPRIEIYSEVDKGNPNAGNDKWETLDGDVVHGGKADYQPYISRKTFFINKEQKTHLFQTTLKWLPYFGVEKEAITLEQYFQAVADTDRYPFYKMLPHDLGYFFSQKDKDENFPYYKTLLTYETSYPQDFTVVWLNENTWFVNEVFYSALGGFFEFMDKPQEELLMEGEFDRFLRFFPIFQYKLTEGFPSIKLHPLRQTIPLNDIVLALALSPGMPNTHSYSIQITGDGSIISQGFKSNDKINPNQLTAILFEAQKLDWGSYRLNKMPKPFIHDKQNFSISAWKEGILHHLDDFDTSSAPLMDFIKMVQEVPEIKDRIERSRY